MSGTGVPGAPAGPLALLAALLLLAPASTRPPGPGDPAAAKGPPRFPPARTPPPDLQSLVLRLARMTAVTGFEEAAAESLVAVLPGARPDAFGNVVWTTGAAPPSRVAICPLDEPGYAVGGITPEAYLTLKRVGRRDAAADAFLEGQRVTVHGRAGPVEGVVGVRSIHLQSRRPDGSAAKEPLGLAEAFVDVGAATPAALESLGVGVPAPVARFKSPQLYGRDLLAAPSAAARAGCAALLGAALALGRERNPRAAVVFARGERLGGGGARVALRELAGSGQVAPFPIDVVRLGGAGPPDSLGAGTALETPDSTLTELIGSRGRAWSLPARYAGSPVESVSLADAAALADRLRSFLSGQPDRPRAETPPPVARESSVERETRPGRGPAEAGSIESSRRPPVDPRIEEAGRVLSHLVQVYGVSGSEGPVRDAVRGLLPGWAKASVDSAGNLRLRVGSGRALVVFVAHLDEIGFEVSAIRDDGRLELASRGGFYVSLFAGEPALVHTTEADVPGVFAPPESSAVEGTSLALDVGTRSRRETEALGIRIGDTATMPKALTRLAGSRVTARSLDDRVGCAALLLALSRLDRAKLGRAVEFVWSTREEVGLLGARAAAADLGRERPARVHAVDTFVSSDAPLERRTIAFAPLGGGAVLRAVDDSAVAPPVLVDSLSALTRELGIPFRVGATGGGNDGSVFSAYGVPDVAIGWPLRYSHSPAEVMDLADLVALSDVVRAIAERW